MSAVIFDLDGTLLNTLEDLADSANAALEDMGLPAHPVDAYRAFVGDGIAMLATRALPDHRRDETSVGRCVSGMSREYEQRWSCKTRPYSGVVEMLGELSRRGLPLAVFSNKPHEFATLTVQKLLPEGMFQVVRGAMDGVTRKPDPEGALIIATELGLGVEEILYVGDSNTDMRTARAAGMRPVGVGWGFRSAEELRTSGAETLLEHPMDLLDLI